MRILLQEFRVAIRRGYRSPAVFGVTLVSFTVGIAATLAAVLAFDAIFLRPLPVRDPGRLMKLASEKRDAVFQTSTWELIRDNQKIFDEVAALAPETLVLSTEGDSRLVTGLYVSGNALAMFGVDTVIGRRLNESDDQVGVTPVCLISHAFWRRAFSSDPGVLGTTVQIGGRPVEIVGVAEPRFFGVEVGRQVDILLPIAVAVIAGGKAPTRSAWLHIVGHLPDAVTAEQAGAALRAWQPALRQLAGDSTASNLRDPLDAIRFDRGLSSMRDNVGEALGLLVAAAAALLLVVCCNVAVVKLASLIDEQPAFAVRRALGATRFQLFLAGCVDLLLLGSIGAAGGALLALWLLTFIIPLLATPLDRGMAPYLSVPVDLRLFSIVMAVFLVSVSGMAGISGAFASSRNTVLTRSTTAWATRRWSIGLVTAILAVQIGIAVSLLGTAGLLISSLVRLTGQPTAVEDDGVVLASLHGLAFDPAPERTIERLQTILTGIQHVPGVSAVSASTLTPLSGIIMLHRIEVPGVPPVDLRDLNISVNRITPDFFSVFGTHITAGRAFTDHDGPRATKVAILNSAMAEHYFRGESALGRVIKLNDRQVQIVGIVETGKYMMLREPARPFVYVPLVQWIDQRPQPVRVAARGSSAQAMRAAVLQTVRRIDPAIVVEFRTLTDEIASGSNRERLMALMASGFAILALVVAAAGLYGSFSYSITRRTREFGIRAALGASPAVILRLVWLSATILLVSGVVLGMAGRWALSGVVDAILFGIEANDPLNLLTAAGAMIVTGAVATYLPSRRASRLDPAANVRTIE